MGMKVSIRPAATVDRPKIEAASRQTWEDHRTRQPHAFAENGWGMLRKRNQQLAAWTSCAQPVGKCGNLIVAVAEGGVAGFILRGRHVRDDAPAPPDGWVMDISVHPQKRETGGDQNFVSYAKRWRTRQTG